MYATAIKKIVHGISPENKNHSQTRGGWRKKCSTYTDWKSLNLHNWPDCFCAWEFWQQSHKKWVSPLYSPHGLTARPLPKLCGHFQSCQLHRLKMPPPPSLKIHNAPSLIKFSSCWCCCPLSRDQLTLPTAHEGKKSTWLSEMLTFTPRPQHLQKP